MAANTGDVICASNVKRAVCLYAGGAANSPPNLATQGIPNYPDNNVYANDSGACFAVLCAKESTLLIASTAGSGTMTIAATLWGYLAASQQWYPIKVNGGVAIAEYPTIADKITYSERFLDLGHYDRLYLEVSSVGGAGVTFDTWLVTAKEGQ